MAKKALGRGLDALIRRPEQEKLTSEVGPKGEQMVQQVPLTRLVPSPLQPRKLFSDEQLSDLLESIKEHGIIQPLIVREVGKNLELIAGERRFRASEKLGLKEVPVIIRSASDRDVLEMALIENLQREDLNPIEEAEAYVRLSQEFSLKQEDIARRVGRKRATVANSMRLLDLPESVLALVRTQHISSGHAKAILGLSSDIEQIAMAEEVVRKKLSVRATEKQVSDHLGKKNPAEPSRNTSNTEKPTKAHPTKAQPTLENLTPELRSIRKRLRDHFATQVEIRHAEKKGVIEIEYYGADDLQRLLEFLGLEEEW